ncbi:MAG: methyltransferase [Hyphomicrobiaceae bacterium]
MRQSLRAGTAADAHSNGQPRLQRIAAAIQTGDLPRACRLLEAELRKAPASTRLRLQLARIKEATGDRDGAAAEYTRVLRIAPRDVAAAAALGRVLAEGRLASNRSLDPAGLAAGLTHATVDRDLLGAAALEFIAREGSLAPILAHCRDHGMDAAVLTALNRRSAPILRDPLLLAVLENCTVADLEIERLLTTMRRVLLLALPRERLAEPDIARFATALAVQCWTNEYVFAVTAEERSVLGSPPSPDAVLAGDEAACREQLLHALYRNPLHDLLDKLPVNGVSKLRPSTFSAFLEMLIHEHQEIASLAPTIVTMGSIEKITSLKVKAQYETYPYPRWRSTALYPGGRFSDYLEGFFSKRELNFVGAPFELLVAGCGTGLQAVSAALDYGPAAHVTGLDISSASLGYAALMARRLEARNLSLVLGDIARIGSFDPSWKGRFHVIECCGVLHHMDDPFAAWKGLLECLAPGGIMLIGLYSSLARRDLEALRQEPEYPGIDADDEALRRYRHHLISRGPEAPGAGYLRARDTATTSGFRDFFLHVNEKPTTLAGIKTFLDENGLEFRGFTNAPFGSLAKRFPAERWPGRLDSWGAFELEQPNLFVGMYQFWLTRR